MLTFSNLHSLFLSLLVFAVIFSNSHAMREKTLSKEKQKFYKDIVAKTDEQISHLNAGTHAAFTTMFKALEAATTEEINVKEITRQLNGSIKAANSIGHIFNQIGNEKNTVGISLWKRFYKKFLGAKKQWKNDIQEGEKYHALKRKLSWTCDDYQKGISKTIPEIEDLEFNVFHILQQHNHALTNAAFYLKIWKDKNDIRFLLRSLEALLKAEGVKNILFLTEDEQKKKQYKKCSVILDAQLKALSQTLKKVESDKGIERPSLQEKLSLGHAVAQHVTHPALLKSLADPELHNQLISQPAAKKMVPEKVISVIKWVDSISQFADQYPTLKSIGQFGLGILRDSLILGTSFVRLKKQDKAEQTLPGTMTQTFTPSYLTYLQDRYFHQKYNFCCDHYHNYIVYILANRMGDISSKHDDIVNDEKRAAKLQAKLQALEETQNEVDSQVKARFIKDLELVGIRKICKEFGLELYRNFAKKPLEILPLSETQNSNFEDLRTVKTVEAFEKSEKKKSWWTHKKATDNQQQLENNSKNEIQSRQNFEISRIYYAPEDYLYRTQEEKIANEHIYNFIKERKSQFQEIVDNLPLEIITLEIPLYQLLSWWVLSQLNIEVQYSFETREDVQNQHQKFSALKEALSDKTAYFEKKRLEAKKHGFSSTVRGFASFIFSRLKYFYYSWGLSKNFNKRNEVQNTLDILEKDMEKCRESKELKAFDQKFPEGKGNFIIDGKLQQRITILADREEIFQYALPPYMRTLKKQPQKNIRFINESRSFYLKDSLKLPEVQKIVVPRQNGCADCGMRALLNAKKLQELSSQSSIIDNQEYQKELNELKKVAQESSWASDETMIKLINDKNDDIIFFPSVTYFKEGKFVEWTMAAKVQNLQQQLRSQKDFCQKIVIGDMDERTNQTAGHYIALVIMRNGDILSIKMANSLPSYNCDATVKKFLNILETIDFENILDERYREKVTMSLGILGFRKIFKDKQYTWTKALDSSAQKSTYINGCMETEKDIAELKAWLLENAQNLLTMTQGKALWTPDGFVDTRAIIQETLAALRECHGKTVLEHPREIFRPVFITAQEELQMQTIEAALELN